MMESNMPKWEELSEIEKAVINADVIRDECTAQQEKLRRQGLSPRKRILQSSADMIDIKVNEWNDKAFCEGKAGTDHKVLWEAVRALAKLHRHTKTDAEITRWFASWVKNQLLAEINTKYSD
jgi:hypothetical protein